MKKQLLKFNQKTFCLFIFPLLTLNSQAQVKGLYVDFFGTSILGVDADNDLDFEREDQLLQYAQVRGYNYLILLGMSTVFSV